MATTSTSQAYDASHQPTEFELRRSALVGRIGDSLEQVLQQINALNRSLEGIIEIGNEFASVEALWSQFESVMGMPADNAGDTTTAAATDNTNDDTVTGNTRDSQTGGRSRGDEDDDETGTEQDDTITPR